jgi:hypothetical protein
MFMNSDQVVERISRIISYDRSMSNPYAWPPSGWTGNYVLHCEVRKLTLQWERTR